MLVVNKTLIIRKLTYRTQAFTALEMLVATFVLSLLSIILFTTLDSVTKVTTTAQGKSLVYQDIRTVLDGVAREMQQAIPISSGSNDAFRGGSGELHFIATIDNNKGYEEVEVHYQLSGGTLKKTMTYGDDSAWDFDNPGAWYTTVGTLGYAPILEGVKDFKFEFWSPGPADEGTGQASWQGNSNSIPAYARITISAYDSNLIRRFGSVGAIPASQSDLYRSFSVLVHLPRSEQ
jgi:type II secretory pathway pseudopilin PulG